MTPYFFIAVALLLIVYELRRPRLYRSVEITGTVRMHNTKTGRNGITTAFYILDIDGFEQPQTIPICPAFHFPDWLTTGARFRTSTYQIDFKRQRLTAYAFGSFTQIEEPEPCPA